MQKPDIVENDGFLWLIRPESEINGKLQDELGSEHREAHNLAAMEKYADPDKAFIDIGACVGGFAVRASKLFKQVYAYEASDFNFSGLMANIALNNIHNVGAYNIYVGDNDGFVSVQRKGGGSRQTDKDEWDPVEVVSMKLDVAFPTFLESVGMIKIDTEGAEEKILHGAENIINAHKPVILLETHEHTYPTDKTLVGTTDRIKEHLKAKGYKMEKLYETDFGDEHLVFYV